MDRRARRLRRARPVIALGAAAFAVGAIVGANHTTSMHTLAAQFTTAWAHGDYAAMYADIDDGSRRTLSASDFAAVYEEAALTATATRLEVAGKPKDGAGGVEVVPVRVYTRLFGTLSSSFRLTVLGSGERAHVVWSRALAFPGLRAGEQLIRHTTLPARAALLARDGSLLASGPGLAAGQRSSPLGAVASALLGTIGPTPPSRTAALESQGVPSDAIVGLTGLERALDDRLRGTAGGELLAGTRTLASVATRAAPAVRTTISPVLQRAAVSALGGQFGGVVAMRPASGEILAVAGIGLNDLQPPGSTFKLVTLTGVLQAGIAHSQSTFPYQTAATLDGVLLRNAGGESCGGSLALAFAVSCNSVFAPLGAKLGAARLVATAERFGFNRDPGIPGALQSTLPPADQIQGDLGIGSTAIGQGMVQASVLQMATVAATIADGGRRPAPTFTPTALAAAQASRVRVTSTDVAHAVRRMMTGVVRFGTGRAAAIPGVVVAGKTGTAELASACADSGTGAGAGTGTDSSGGAAGSGTDGSQDCPAADDPSNTDAWFTAFAPALRPRIVVGVLLVKDGAGGDTAAPVARQVLQAGLQLRF
ncbi:MAG TPA: penicillin-binding transpeptidase domain-containing protein [Solirubrobacteraceae bacterium]|nr:penicillin-binding transpeptidase domain-containing protein [Solirubrobacteraceae bacterium]